MFSNKVISALPDLLALLIFLPVYGAAHRMADGSDRACPVCPYFINTPTNVTAPQGVSANLTCGVRNLDDRKVSWIRRRDLHVLTTGAFTYTTDVRFRVVHLEGSPYWTLEVVSPTVKDSGVYECQVSTQPKIFRRFTLNVIVPRAEIRGTQQIFMKAGSDINITCVVAGAVRGASVRWFHVLPNPRNGVSSIEINIGDRGGVQLVTDKNEGTSWLLVTHATLKDAGNYTCAPAFAKPASVSVHILDGVLVAEETPAAMQHDPQPSSGSHRLSAAVLLSHVVIMLNLLRTFSTGDMTEPPAATNVWGEQRRGVTYTIILIFTGIMVATFIAQPMTVPGAILSLTFLYEYMFGLTPHLL